MSRTKVSTNDLEYRRIERFIEALSLNIGSSNGWIQTLLLYRRKGLAIAGIFAPDIFIEPALPVWLPGGSTNSCFVVKWTLIVSLLWFSCVDIPLHQSTLTMNNLNM